MSYFDLVLTLAIVGGYVAVFVIITTMWIILWRKK